jgi:integrase
MMEKTIDTFIAMYPKLNTKKSYRAAIYDFLDHIYGRVRAGERISGDEPAKYEELSVKYFSEERDHLNDLIGFLGNMNGKPPTSIKLKLVGVKEWLSFNGVELSQKELKTLRHRTPKAKGAWTVENEFDIPVLRKILAHADEKAAALILTLASSGVRIGEALNIKLKDVDLSKEPPEFIVRGEYTKGGETRVVFISKEAKAALEEWLNVRDDYIRASLNRNKGLVEKAAAGQKTGTDERVFPFSVAVVREFWSRALLKAGLHEKDNSTGRLQYRIHGLRKFFRSQLALSCPVDIVETLMGHEGYLTDAYRRYTRKQMGEYYLKAEHHVTVTGTGDIREIQDRLQNTQAALRGYKDTITEQTQEIAELKQRYEEQAKKIGETEKIQERIKELEEKLRDVVDRYNKFIEDPVLHAVLLKMLKEVFNEFIKAFRESFELKKDLKDLDLKIDADAIIEKVRERGDLVAFHP